MVFPAFASSPPGGIPDPVVTPITMDDDIPIYFDADETVELVGTDGVLTVPNPFIAPSAPSGVESAVAGALSAGDYEYAVVLITAAGSTTPSANSTPVTVDGSHKAAITLAALPVGGVSWILYRTVVDDPGGDVLLVEADLAAGVYQDDTDDGDLGAAPPTANTAGGNLTVDGEIRMHDDQAIYFREDRKSAISYDTTHGAMLFYEDSLVGAFQIDFLHAFVMYANSENSDGAYSPYIEAISTAFGAGKLNIGVGTDGLNLIGGPINIAAATTAYASMNIPAGTAPTVPADEDIWTDGDNMFIRINGATYKFVLEAA